MEGSVPYPETRRLRTRGMQAVSSRDIVLSVLGLLYLDVRLDKPKARHAISALRYFERCAMYHYVLDLLHVCHGCRRRDYLLPSALFDFAEVV